MVGKILLLLLALAVAPCEPVKSKITKAECTKYPPTGNLYSPQVTLCGGGMVACTQTLSYFSFQNVVLLVQERAN